MTNEQFPELIVWLCLSLFDYAFHCLIMPFIVWLYLPLFDYAFHCLIMPSSCIMMPSTPLFMWITKMIWLLNDYMTHTIISSTARNCLSYPVACLYLFQQYSDYFTIYSNNTGIDAITIVHCPILKKVILIIHIYIYYLTHNAISLVPFPWLQLEIR